MVHYDAIFVKILPSNHVFAEESRHFAYFIARHEAIDDILGG